MSAEDHKNTGNGFFKKKNWSEAIKWYTKSLEVDPGYHVSYSNRSQAYYQLGDYENAKRDGAGCIKANPEFVKGYHRLGNAQFALRDYEGALATCKLAEKRGFRGNRDIAALYDKVLPLAEKAKESAMKQLRGPARYKAEGNALFKQSKYEQAIEMYTKAIDAIGDPGNDTDRAIVLDSYNNRAVCWMQQQNYRQVIADTTAVLNLDEGNLKALFRRAMAFEGLERYRSALEDIRACCVKKPDWAAANKAQHRIGNAVRMLKKMK